MITEAQRIARSNNARLSRGPKTAAGKARSARSRTTHGFCSIETVLPGEDPEQFAAFKQGLVNSYKPAGDEETALVERVVDAAWRLRRFPAAEAQILTVSLCNAHVESESAPPDQFVDEAANEAIAEARAQANRPEYALGRAFIYDARTARALSTLTRYESAIDRAFFRTTAELRRVQEIRKSLEKVTPIDSHTPAGIQARSEKLRNDLTDFSTSEILTHVDSAA